MSQWGFDISNYQGDSFDMPRAARDGFSFAFFKATQGASYKDWTFAGNLSRGQAAGLYCAAYHYQTTDSVGSQVANICSVVPSSCPVIIDVEKGAGGVDITRGLVSGLEGRGYTVVMSYIPKWYWQQIGSPNLAGLPPLWYSVYASNNGGTASQLWASAKSWYLARWGGYGGLSMAVMQFTSHASVAGRSPIDASIYRGTKQELEALLGGANTEAEDGFLMGLPQWKQDRIFDRILAMSEGVPGENYSGDQFTHEQAFRDQLGRKLKTAASGDDADPSYEADVVTYARNADGYGYDTQKRLDALEAKIDSLSVGGVDADALAADVVAKLGTALSAQVADLLAKRLAD